jgi:hypothetical protein
MGQPGMRTVAEPTRNLLIVHTPNFQDISDWHSVKHRIDEKAPDIEVRIATNGARNSVTRRWQGSRPSLVFSPFVLREYQPNGGTVYACQAFSKLEQIERLARQGSPVPLTATLTFRAASCTCWGCLSADRQCARRASTREGNCRSCLTAQHVVGNRKSRSP